MRVPSFIRIGLIGILLAALLGSQAPLSFALTAEEERTQLEEELRELEKEIAQYEQNISQTQAQSKTLQNEVYVLENRIKQLNAQVALSNRLAQDLGTQIIDTTESISQTEEDVGKTRGQLKDLLQLIYQEDQKTVVEIVLAGDDVSEFFQNVVGLELIQKRNRDLLNSLHDLNEYLQSQKASLEQEKSDQENLAKLTALQRQQSQETQQEKDRLLTITRGQEAEYQKILQDRQREAQEIRSRLFELIGVPEAPTFGEALAIAESVSAQIGVRPAFLLAILTQESNLGKNVGQCYMTNPANGNGVNIRTGAAVTAVMKPMGLAGRRGDVNDFITITKELGRDPFATPVSCPIPSVGGYGGAMGPAQFIPTTWMYYRDRLATILGKPADPWNIIDAFYASALYVGDYGAKQQTYTGEWRAAMIYFSGSTNPRYRFYGDSVMAITERYQRDINTLKGN